MPTGDPSNSAAPRVTPSAAIAAGLPAGGSLWDASALELHFLAAATRASGRLELRAGEGTFHLTYRRGVVEHATSSREEDDVAAFLARRGLLAPEAAVDARQLAPAFGGDVLGALVELRLVDPAARFAELREHGAALARTALTVEDGDWSWDPGAAPPASAFPLASRLGLLAEVLRHMDPARVRSRLGVREALAIGRVGGRVEIPDLLLNPQEARAVARIDGVRSVEELCVAFPAEADVLRRVALLLAETELATFGAPRLAAAPPPPRPPAPAPAPTPAPAPAKPPPTPAPAKPPPTPAPAKPPPTPAPAKPPPAAPSPAPSPRPPPATTPKASPPSLQALEATARTFRESDHFQVLGVPRDAELPRIKSAYFQLARTYHPDAGRGEPPEAQRLRSEIFARVAAAWAVLETDAGRQAYLEELRSGGPAQVDIARIYQAEQAFEKVGPLVSARSYAEALARVNEAIALYADEPEYHAWRGWLEFLVAPEPQRRTQRMASEQAIEGALKKSPRCAPGWLFLGRIARLSGDPEAAERAWRRGLEQVQDPELERELRFLKR